MVCQECNDEKKCEPAWGAEYCADCLKQKLAAHWAHVDNLWAGNATSTIIPTPMPESYGAKWETIAPHHKALLPFVKGTKSAAIFYGPWGRGKTWAAWATTHAVLYQTAKEAGRHYYVSWNDLLTAANQYWAWGSVSEGAKNQLKVWERALYLFIDEFATTKPNSNELSVIHNLLMVRCGNFRRTLISTTMSQGELMEVVGGGIPSRFFGSLSLEFKGQDRRI